MIAEKHIPVLANAVLRCFQINTSINCYADFTVGLGGHATLVAEALCPKHIIAFDRDAEMLKIAESKLRNFNVSVNQFKLDFYHANYSELKSKLEGTDLKFDAALLDLGVASPHFDDSERGLSLRQDGQLDMRLDRSQKITAFDIVNTYSESELGRIFREYGEERHWRAAARRIVANRFESSENNKNVIRTTTELVDLLRPVLGPRKAKAHPATKIFQAIRIEVNDELNHLTKALPDIIDMLSCHGGKLVVISYHSLEDRIVKKIFAQAFQDRIASCVSKNPVLPEASEIEENPRARSAKLRLLVKS